MATSTGPDLSYAAEAVEALMDDTVQAARETDPESWVMGPDLRLQPPADAIVYDGRAKMKPLSTVDRDSVEGGVSLSLESYRIDLPLDAVRLPYGATITVTSSRRMPQSVGETFIVRGLVVKTMAVQTSYAAERQLRAEGAPA